MRQPNPIHGPEMIGCGRKLPPSKLAPLITLHRSRFPLNGGLDASVWPIANSRDKFTVVSSIDRVAEFTDDTSLFAIGALNHFENDIVCGMAQAQVFSLSFTFADNDVEAGYHLELADAVFRYADDLGATVGKCHSYLGSDTAITGHTFGLRDSVAPTTAESGEIFLTKPIGAVKTIYLQSLGYDCPGIGSAIAQIRTSHRTLAPLLAEHKALAGDVSGFGLIGALEGVCGPANLRASIDPSRVRYCDDLVQQISVGCLVSDDVLNECRTIDWDATPPDTMALTEVAGGLVVLVPGHTADQFADDARRLGFNETHRIGSWKRPK